MEIKEAIEWQNAFKRTHKGNPMEKEVYEACDMAIDALEKQIFKKPKMIEVWECPICGSECIEYDNYGIDSEKKNFCPDCGQKIDWGMEDNG